MSHPSRGVNWHIISIVFLAWALFFVGLHHTPVPTIDGAVRAVMARNLLQTGQLFPAIYEGAPLLDHPPLYVWVTALSYKIFGVNDFAFNLVPRLFALLTVLVTALIGLKSGLGRGTALLAAFILCSTRDFVLSSVRGYIEPVLEFFIYSAFLFIILQRKRRSLLFSTLAGLCTFLALFSKGPVVLWPLLFFAFLLALPNAENSLTLRARIQSLCVYVSSLLICVGAWAFWVEKSDQWRFWQQYLFDQVLGSALTGRAGAQTLEPFFFFDILLKYYWPWLPLLVWALVQSLKNRLALVFAVFGLGFLGGFSLVKWKFWYYIAPAYPAFALAIAAALHKRIWNWLEHPLVPKTLLYLSVVWIFIGSTFPLKLYRERVPEVMAFKETIRRSEILGPVWFVDHPGDHNQIGTSGEWYFERSVLKVNPVEIGNWSKQLPAQAWVITGLEKWKACNERWCQHSTLIQTAGQSALVLYSRSWSTPLSN
ncbi:MAG: glycosyltransferase family 39 protein [Bdellovibrionota bacterium]